jgi:hypothetical protein
MPYRAVPETGQAAWTPVWVVTGFSLRSTISV